MKFRKDKIDIKGLDVLEKLLRRNKISVKVGILGNDDSRGEEGTSNAAIGLIHEFGTENVEQRSFLRMPLEETFSHKLEAAGAFDRKTIQKVIKEKSFKTMAKKIGIVAEECIQDAFDTGGFGKWKLSNYKLKKNSQTLVETTQLRKSISSEVSS